MAMTTYMQQVSADEIARLRREPEWIMKLDKPGAYATAFACSLNYFVGGDAYPDADEPFGNLFYGEAIACPSLENGNFDVITPERVAALVPRLAELDLAEIAKAIGVAEFDDLIEDEELYDLELLDEDEDAAKLLVGELRSLIAFHSKTAKLGLGLVVYTT